MADAGQLGGLVLVGEQAEALDVAVGAGLQALDHVGPTVLAEQVRVAALQLQVFGHRDPAADLGDRDDLAVLGLEDREQPRLLDQPGEPDRVACEAEPQPSGQGTKTWM